MNEEWKKLLDFCKEQESISIKECDESDLEINKSIKEILDGPKQILSKTELSTIFSSNYLNGAATGKAIVYSKMVRIVTKIIEEEL